MALRSNPPPSPPPATAPLLSEQQLQALQEAAAAWQAKPTLVERLKARRAFAETHPNIPASALPSQWGPGTPGVGSGAPPTPGATLPTPGAPRWLPPTPLGPQQQVREERPLSPLGPLPEGFPPSEPALESEELDLEVLRRGGRVLPAGWPPSPEAEQEEEKNLFAADDLGEEEDQFSPFEEPLALPG